MKAIFEDYLWIIANSRRAQAGLAIGVLLFSACLILGHVMTQRIEFASSLAPLADPVRHLLLDRYERIAGFALFASWAATTRFLSKERRRLLAL